MVCCWLAGSVGWLFLPAPAPLPALAVGAQLLLLLFCITRFRTHHPHWLGWSASGWTLDGREVLLVADRSMYPGLLVLQFRVPVLPAVAGTTNNARAAAGESCSLILWPDSAAPADLRRLRVRLLAQAAAG